MEQQKKLLELSNRPTLALYMGIPDQLIPVEIKSKKLQPFMPPPWERSQLRPTQGRSKTTYQNKKKWGDQSVPEGTLPEEGKPQHPENQENLRNANL